MAFDVEGARKAGYSDAEIAAFLAKSSNYDLKAAKSAGYSDGDVIAHLAGTKRPAANAIPGVVNPTTGAEVPKPAPAAPARAPTVGQRIEGGIEAGLTAVTGATGGTLGMLGGTLKGLADAILSGKFGTAEAADLVERTAAAGAQALTYEPRTQQGQEQAAALGEALQQVLPAVAVAPALMPRGVAAPAAAAVKDATRAAPPAAATAARAAAAAAQERLPAMPARTPAAATPGTMGSAGAAGTDLAVQRAATADSMDVPLQLTKGQASRDPAQLKFEVETAKMPEEGAPLRTRYAEQNEAILKNFDAWMDQTGAEAPSLRAVGVAVDKALVEQAKRDKTEYRVAYKEAEKAGEMAEPVSAQPVADLLNSSTSAEALAPVLGAAKKELVRLGGAELDSAGTLVARDLTLGDMEFLRKFVNRVAGVDPTNVKYAVDLKQAIDSATDGLGGAAYKRARALRQRYAQNYENRATVAKLLDQKRGTADRQVALEDVFSHTVLKGSLDDVRNVRRVLHRGGPEGKQAWRELQGATMGWVKEEATRGVATDMRGNPVVSPAGLNKAISALDADGKLQFVFGRNGAQKLRDLNDLAKYVRTVPPEAGVNTSNTAATLLTAFADVVFSGATGTPAPVATATRLAVKQIRDAKLRRRIQDALTDLEKRAPNNRPNTPISLPSRGEETVH